MTLIRVTGCPNFHQKAAPDRCTIARPDKGAVPNVLRASYTARVNHIRLMRVSVLLVDESDDGESSDEKEVKGGEGV